MIQVINNKRKSPNSRAFSLFFLLAYAALVITIGTLLKIQRISCVVDSQLDDNYCQKLSYLIGKSLFFTNLEQTDLFLEPQINDSGQVYLPVSYYKNLSGTLTIIFNREDPLYRIKFDESKYLVNSKQYLVKDHQEFDLTLVELSNSYIQDVFEDRISSELHSLILNLVDQLENYSMNNAAIFLNKDDSIIRVGNTEFIFSDNQPAEQLIPSIKMIISDLSKVESSIPDSSEIESIDMRFRLPVVRYR